MYASCTIKSENSNTSHLCLENTEFASGSPTPLDAATGQTLKLKGRQVNGAAQCAQLVGRRPQGEAFRKFTPHFHTFDNSPTFRAECGMIGKGRVG
jgi:hypothetical protein